MHQRLLLALGLAGTVLLAGGCQNARLVPDPCGGGCVAAPLLDPCRALDLRAQPVAHPAPGAAAAQEAQGSR